MKRANTGLLMLVSRGGHSDEASKQASIGQLMPVSHGGHSEVT